ncbi:MAG: sulfur carrier protein ThiS [Alphaproteobacteria bacterium]
MSGNIRLNGEDQPWSDQTLRDLVAGAGVDLDKGGLAIARNGEVVPRADWAQTRLEPNDSIEIVHIVRGG